MSAEPKTFAVPDLGEGLEEVTVTSWNVAVGDQVELNQVLCTVETAKAEVEIPSPYAGRVAELGGAQGDVLAVGAPLVRIDTGTAEGSGPAEAAPAGRTPVLVGYGADDTFDSSRRTCATTGRPKAKPGARKLAAELGVDLSGVPPGPSGVITTDGVLAAAGGEELRAPSAVQAAMAERMTLSRSRIPDAHGSVQVDCANLVQLRDRLAAGPDGAAITPFVLTLRLLVIALTRHPVLNATWVEAPEGPRVRTHRAIHLGVGVAAPRGLLVPVVFDAQRKTTRELADCVARLIADARAGSLKPAELQGSTFTVSNFGALGLDDGVPVINYPEAAILGMGSLKPRPVALGDTVAVRPQMTLTCAFDHRIADGAQVAEFLCALRDLIEHPDTALLDL
ncbi:dihydrolipoamide acetyltransferase component of pyruvate dehydrogenase complex [Mycolicibacter terrae]|uniref:Dihydrolipoamide acetyltransferase component of pyruvate dehydrogenase complex n=1 Tax=Mycolicibacter terrae TaxID=1788 RepID=A0AAD1HZX6_9MYCO|nr:dihydrolipoamide acetyltransferase family protein [Mycolicibacter terrae]ORW94877.1 branched-chain alpha-keto acid dehydrogenase subunit E2 [Mycolicibacter terrae]BBX23330.1 dihydrolipoamide acetyltransferase component of pyruvate dehydrogenase complex [Mycolicibacter terrae]SNV65130.1 dihydrolipoamide S-acetyltransferase [Mycolicibacter terrae]